MSTTVDPQTLVLIEQAAPRPIARSSRSRSDSKFGAYAFTRKGKSGSITKLVGTAPAVSSARKVMVFRFAEAAELPRASELVKTYRTRKQPMIAVAAPEVFNLPDFRTVLVGDHVEVVVEEQERFKPAHLVPWIERLLRRMHGKHAAKAASADPLDISVRLRDPDTGRLDAMKIAGLFSMSLTDLAKVCGVSKQSLSQNPTSAGMQERLQPLEEIAQFLQWCGDDEPKFRAWLKRPDRGFARIGGRAPSPMDLILAGHAEIAAHKVRNLTTGHPA
jgi:hypothetical protein